MCLQPILAQKRYNSKQKVTVFSLLYFSTVQNLQCTETLISHLIWTWKYLLKMTIKVLSNIAEIFRTASWTKTSPNLNLCFIKIANHLPKLYTMILRLIVLSLKDINYVLHMYHKFVTDFNYDSTLLLQSVSFHVSCNFIANWFYKLRKSWKLSRQRLQLWQISIPWLSEQYVQFLSCLFRLILIPFLRSSRSCYLWIWKMCQV